MNIPVVITLEAGLSFLGVGIRPPLASWGSMLFDGFTYLEPVGLAGAGRGRHADARDARLHPVRRSLRDAIDPKLRREP